MDAKSLYALHASFKTGEPAPEGWYREGEELGDGAWVVDLDLFVEVALPAEEWESKRGSVFELTVGDTDLEIDLPQDVSFEECWTLEGCGLFEPGPDVTEDQLAEAEEIGADDELGRFGDLYVVPIVT